MSPTGSRARRFARKLSLLPLLVAGLLVALAPAAAAPKNATPGKSAVAKADHKKVGKGDGRKFK